MTATAIEKVKKGDFIRRKSDAKTTYQYEGYCRYNRKYYATDCTDIGKQMYFKKGTIVFIDFEF